ncbi:MAG: tetratricopeptide repeat protein [Candidatus Brocadiia bacterium]
MKPFLRRSLAFALAALLGASCAGQPAGAGAASSPAATGSSPATTASSPATPESAPPTMAPPMPGVVLLYEPKTLEETTAVVKLVRDDLEIRPVLEKAEEETIAAIRAFQTAALALRSPPRGQGARPTKEAVEKLHKAADEKVARYQGLIQHQRDEYEAFLQKYPDNWFERHRYATFLADLHLADEAADEWRRVIEQAPTFPYAYNDLATLYNHMGRDLEAILLYRKAIELYPDDADFHVNLAVNYSTHRTEASREFGWTLPVVFHECILSYQRARALRPKDPEIAYDLASQYVLAKFFGVKDSADEAIEAWKYYLALDLTPTQRGVAERNVATLYLKQKNDPAAAQKLLEEALTLLPDDSVCKTLLKQAAAAQAKPAP